MTEILKYITIKSSDKMKFEEQITERMKQGWELVDGGYSFYNDVYTREMVYKKDERIKIEFYENGQVESRYNLNIDGKRHGKCVGFHENGDIAWEENYDNGVKDGEYNVWYEDDDLREQGFFENGKKTGNWKRWYENGNLKKERTFKDNHLNGQFRSYYPDGSPMLEGEYVDDRTVVAPMDSNEEDSWERYRYTTEHQEYKLYGFDGATIYNKCGIWKFWDKEDNYYEGVPVPSPYYDKLIKEDKCPQIDFFILDFSSGVDSWHNRGIHDLPICHKISERFVSPFSNEDIIINTEFYSDGSIAIVSPKKVCPLNRYQYKNIDTYCSWYHNGEIKIKENYIELKDDKKELSTTYDGEYELNYINGSPCIKGAYKEGKEIGLWERYHPNGQPERVYYYGQKELKIEVYNKKGIQLYAGSIEPKGKLVFNTNFCELGIVDWEELTYDIWFNFWYKWPRYGHRLTINPESFNEINDYIKNDFEEHLLIKTYFCRDTLTGTSSQPIFSHLIEVNELFPYPNRRKK